ncbi:class I SAM-dependent methyltransferase [Candidatus Altiarchaeota archaeon]
MTDLMKEHWDGVYDSRDVNELGWYEENPGICLDLLAQCRIGKDAAILDVGCGASTFIDCLIGAGYENITATDISAVAIDKLKERLGEEKSSQVKWIVDDVSQPTQIQNLRDIDLWHDRAVLHFLCQEDQRKTYFDTLKRVVRKGGHVIIAAFSLAGAKKCSGLDVVNYDQNMLAKRLGEDFDLLTYFDHTYHTPSGKPRPYIYALFQKK